jgi:nitrate reductase gamma subunit
MSIGLGIFLFVVGAILRFAVNVQVSWINLQLVGDFLMVAGGVVVIIGIVLLLRKRSSVTTVRTAVDPASGESVASRETRVDPPVE